jgi:DNA transposition AAA+ family ATPase
MHNSSHPETGRQEQETFTADQFLREQLLVWRNNNKQQDGSPHTNASIARKLGYSPAVISTYLATDSAGQLAANKYTGDVAKLERKVEDFLRNETRRRLSGVETKDCEVAQEMKTGLEYIRKTNDIGEIIAESGDGKSRGIEIYLKENPTAILFHVRSWARDLGSIEGALFTAVGKAGYDNRTKRALWMVTKLRGSDRLIIVDDAHKLTRPALQFLFDFHDETGCPIALVGTFALEELLEDDAQRFSRTGLRWEVRPNNSRKLIEHLVTSLAPTVNGEFDQVVALCEMVAAEHGHFRSVHKQLKLAAEIKEQKPRTSWTDALKAAHTLLIRKYALT